jgi:hypothetical protein
LQTYSHYILTAFLNRKLKAAEARHSTEQPNLTLGSTKLPPLHTAALMIGSIAPDIPLTLLGIGFIASDLLAGRRPGPGSADGQSNAAYLFDYLFFHSKWVMTVHNLFHSPLMILCYLSAGYTLWRSGRRGGGWLFWFAVACALHTMIDIPLHTDDGPLLLFPFNWELRFHSPLSYWDPAHYGNIFSPLEHLLIAGVLIYLVVDWWRTRRQRQAALST